MNPLFSAIGDVDGTLIEEAAEAPKRRRAGRTPFAVGVAVAAAIAVVFLLNAQKTPKLPVTTDDPNPGTVSTTGEPPTRPHTTAPAATEAETTAADVVPETRTDGQTTSPATAPATLTAAEVTMRPTAPPTAVQTTMPRTQRQNDPTTAPLTAETTVPVTAPDAPSDTYIMINGHRYKAADDLDISDFNVAAYWGKVDLLCSTPEGSCPPQHIGASVSSLLGADVYLLLPIGTELSAEEESTEACFLVNSDGQEWIFRLW